MNRERLPTDIEAAIHVLTDAHRHAESLGEHASASADRSAMARCDRAYCALVERICSALPSVERVEHARMAGFRAGVQAAARWVTSIEVPGYISAQFVLDLATGIRALASTSPATAEPPAGMDTWSTPADAPNEGMGLEAVECWLAGAFTAYRAHGMDVQAAQAKAAWLRQQLDSGRTDPLHLWDLDAHTATAEPTREGAPTPSWFPEDDPPINPGWYGVMRKDGTLCLRAFGNGEWWIPLRDGWLSGLPPGFKWCGPFEPVEWDTPRETSGRSPASGGEGTT